MVENFAPTLYTPEQIEKASAMIGNSSPSSTLPSGGSDGIFRMSMNDWHQQHLADADYHLHFYRTHPWVRSCVDRIVQFATTDQYSIEGPDDQAQALQEYLEEVSPENKDFDRILESIYRDLAINGNSYLRMTYAKGKPAFIFRVPFTQIVPDVPKKGGGVTSYSIYTGDKGLGSKPESVNAREIIHFVANDAGFNHTGISPLESLDTTLMIDLFATKYQEGFFVNGVKAGDIYASDGQMDAESYARDKQYLMATFTKPSQSYTPLFLSGNWKQIARGVDSRKDADFLELRKWNREEICSVYNVPLSMMSTAIMGAMGATGKEQDRDSFINGVIAPLQKKVLKSLNYQLLVKQLNNRSVKLVPPGRSALRLEDMQSAKLMSQIGATANEIRASVNLPEIKGGDIPLFLQPGSAIVGLPGHDESVLLTSRGALPGVYVPLDETTNANLQDPLSTAQSGWDDPGGAQPQYKTVVDTGKKPTGQNVPAVADAAAAPNKTPTTAAAPAKKTPPPNPNLGKPLKGAQVNTNRKNLPKIKNNIPRPSSSSPDNS